MWPSLIIDYLNYACSRGTLHKEQSQKLYEHGSGEQMGEVIYAPESSGRFSSYASTDRQPDSSLFTLRTAAMHRCLRLLSFGNR